MDVELESILIKARELDKNLKNSFSYNSYIEEWASENIKFDQNQNKNDKNGEFANGNFFPSKDALINPDIIKELVISLYDDVQKLKSKNKNITTPQIRSAINKQKYSLLRNKYLFIFNKLTTCKMDPPYYKDFLIDMLHAQKKIINGGDVDKIEAAIEARFLYYNNKTNRT